MNKTFILLAISIFIFCIVIFSIIYIAISNSGNKTTTKTTKINENKLEKAIEESTEIYDEYSNNPNYNLTTVEYQILGTLSSLEAEPETIILPLYGKRVKSYRWKYYTLVNGLKIDIKKERNNSYESCMKECDTISNEDIVKVPSYTNTEFKVQLYDYAPPF
jgi:cell division protein FtsI/penicillin-binding protein 2